MLDSLSTFASAPDLLRLLAVPFFGWAAYRDVRTRRVPNRSWLPLALLGVALLAWETRLALVGELYEPELFLLRVALSLGMVAPIGYLFYWFGGFGGADAKALIVLAVLFPTFPTYLVPGYSFPLHPTTVGVFSLTILSNTVLVGAAYPLFVMGRNAVGGHFTKAMFIGKPVPAADVDREYGSLAETPDGFSRRGLDLDALRMYLRWRGCTLADLRAEPEHYRDPTTLPTDPNPPGDGTIEPDGPVDESAEPAADDPVADGGDAASDPEDGDTADYDDPWGAEAFLDDIEGTAYGTTPEKLRGGLDVLAAEEEVWITPGMPFIVPMFLGLVVSLVYGDLLVTAISSVT